jgi:tRNA(Ile)-lysidine synthase
VSLHPSVATVRVAVRRTLAALVAEQPGRGLPPDAAVLVACSGGADSLALLSATVFEGHKVGLRVIGVTVDHGLQEESAAHAEHVVAQMAELGCDETATARVEVQGGGRGPEAAAREARYAVLDQLVQHFGAIGVLLGHTLDDQAETVLLALARGSGLRGLAAMPVSREIDGVTFLRPFLELSRDEARKACAALGLQVWDDPHNADPAYARARVRATALPALVDALGPGVVANLARSARLAAQDVAVFDDLTQEALAAARKSGGLSAVALTTQAPAVRSRVLREWALSLGCPPSALSHRHIDALDALVTAWRGQGPTDLPGGIRVVRTMGMLRRATPAPTD